MRRLTCCLAALLLWAPCHAQSKLKLEFPNDGKKLVWLAEEVPDAPPTSAETVEGTTFSIAVPSPAGRQKIFVWDQTSNNIALAELASLRRSTWTLTQGSYKLIGRLKVRLQHEGQPVAAASLTLKDARREIEQVIDPASKGVAEFFGVALGPVELTARYRSGGGSSRATESHSLTADRREPEPTLVMSIPEKVETVTSAAAKGDSSDRSDRAEPKGSAPGNRAGSLILYILALAAGAAMIFFGFQYARRNEKLVKDKLDRLGVKVVDPLPSDPSPVDPAQTVAQPKAPEPPQQILLSDAAPEPVAAPVAATAALREPRLVRESGEALEVPEGLHVLGREPGLPLTIDDKSVSRRHAQIVRGGQELTVSDLGSTNGTYVNGVKVEGEAVLRPGDALQVGTVRLRVEG